MEVSIKKIGNSKGVILPAHLIKSQGFEDVAHLDLRDDGIFIRPKPAIRDGWDKQFFDAQKSHHQDEDFMELSNHFDDHDWTW